MLYKGGLPIIQLSLINQVDFTLGQPMHYLRIYAVELFLQRNHTFQNGSEQIFKVLPVCSTGNGDQPAHLCRAHPEEFVGVVGKYAQISKALNDGYALVGRFLQ